MNKKQALKSIRNCFDFKIKNWKKFLIENETSEEEKGYIKGYLDASELIIFLAKKYQYL